MPPESETDKAAGQRPHWPARALGWLKRGPWAVLREAVAKWQRDDGFLLSAAMAYYAALALFPLLLVLMAGLGLAMRFALAQETEVRLLDVVAENVDPWLADQLRLLLEGVETKAGVGGPLGLVGLLAAAIGVFAQFDSMLERIWPTADKSSRGVWGAVRRALVDRLQAFVVLLAVGGLVAVVLILDVALAAAGRYVADLPLGTSGLGLARSGMTLAMNGLLFTLLYKTIPRARVRWGAALCGGAVVAVAWQIGQRLLTTYAIGEKFTAYGVVGSFLAVMLWVYYSSAAVFFGAEVVCAAGKQGPPPSE